MRGIEFKNWGSTFLALGLAAGVVIAGTAVYTGFGSGQTAASARGDTQELTQVLTDDPKLFYEQDSDVSPLHLVQAPETALPLAEDSGAKGPGLASPPPSSLESAASAVAARNPGRAVKVGIQAGHWRAAELPDELASLRKSTGAEGSGWREVDVNLHIAQKVAGILAPFGIHADLLPSTVPAGYKADAFVSIHGDANSNKSASGFKIAGAKKSDIPARDNALNQAITDAYRSATGLKWHASTITSNMLDYYAFNQKLRHSVDSGTPAVIVELGFLTNPVDREIMTDRADAIAEAIALGILNFLSR